MLVHRFPRRLFGLVATLFCATCAFAQTDQILPPIGGSGGGQFMARCRLGDVLTGVELRAGDDVDSIRPICVTAYAPGAAGPRNLYSSSFGGNGGRVLQLLCPDNAPLVAKLEVYYEGARTQTVNNVHLFCSKAAINQPLPQYPTAVFDGPPVGLTGETAFTGGDAVLLYSGAESCPAGLVPVGLNGRAGIWLDAVGLICGRLLLDSSKAPVQLGRVPSQSPPGPPRPICDVARDARARNSPAAPSLEAQCAASRPIVKSLGRVTTSTAPAAPRTICQAAQDARARNSPAAPSLEAQCRAAGGPQAVAAAGAQRTQELDALAARGAEIARRDPVVAQARVAENDVSYWQGFDIATGLFGDPALGAKGNTATGPGSLGIRDALTPAAQRGFNASVALHLSRDYRSAPPAAQNGPALPAQAGPSAIVISQVYAGGGSAGAVFAGDFVELLNRSTVPVDLSGWSIQYAAANGFAWQVTPLMGAILPGHYLLIGAPAGFAGGNALPTPDLLGRMSMATNAGKLALMRSAAALNGFCPAGLDIADFIGYGSANCSEGGMPAPGLDRGTAAFRREAGCVDTNSNGVDFEVGAAAPRNQATPPAACAAN